MPLPQKVLIVDDFGQMRSTLKLMLQSIGFESIDLAGNGRDALDCLRRTSYDVVLCDYNLGEGKDGQQVLEEAKHRGFIRHSTIFVMITAENTSEMVMGAVEHRPDDYLTKPFTKELLRARLDKLMARKSDLETIDRAIRKGDLAQAIQLCNEKIAERPRNLSELLKIKAGLCMRTNDLAGAEALFQEVLMQRAGVPWAMVGLGEVRRAQRRLTDARDLFRRVVEQTPTYMEAHDLLARTLDELGESADAQRVLEEATRISPKSVKRQHALGGLAVKNADLGTAERAFRRTIALGRQSVYRDPSHYTALAEVQSRTGSLPEALKTLGAVRKEFGDDQANLQAAIHEGLILKSHGRDQEARAAVAEAARLFDSLGSKAGADTALAYAQAQFMAGERDTAMRVMQDLVRNHHEDAALLERAQQTFSSVGLEEEGREVIKRTAAEVVRLNNSGVNLVKEGKIAEALQLFEEAIASMPDNRTINLNAAQALLLYMQKNRPEAERLQKARTYLERVRAVDPDNPTLQKLLPVYDRLAGGNA